MWYNINRDLQLLSPTALPDPPPPPFISLFTSVTHTNTRNSNRLMPLLHSSLFAHFFFQLHSLRTKMEQQQSPTPVSPNPPCPPRSFGGGRPRNRTGRQSRLHS